MFGKKSSTATFSNATTLVAYGTLIKGDIQFAGTLEIEGRIEGNISAESGSKATVRILERGEVEGDINVPSAIVNGRVAGNVYSNEHLELASNAVIDGSVHYNVIEMAKGAQVNGNLMHATDQPEVKAIEHFADGVADGEAEPC
ncbi:cytoskeletal protein CcmA (bactofilin family) [Sinobacterium caligoides]|uniref:Cytoskeletal protein CcmA (Bactofilin family) n=1 Tax=Sinobacterium caligoides TaxID=933926 RepID=A0A3N2DG70_9GAMM|nr:polymer-forming cytoskeletal protein [Sinobacterium caligoides]ROR98796.1 cytoskeletal protein CcmA (bactofilin family) [Sinobacterium caligoides]